MSLLDASANEGAAKGDRYQSIEGVIGGRFDDSLTGNAGANKLNGSAGSDTLTGGRGKDVFEFTSAPGKTNVDNVTDFKVIDDTIHVDNAVFKTLGAAGNLRATAFFTGVAAHDGNDRIVYNDATGRLIFDANGSAAGGDTIFATLAPNLKMTAADFVII